MGLTTLVCEHDGHIWQRESQRGRPPKFCPEHKPEDVIKTVKVQSNATEHKPKSILDLVPGLEEVLAQDNMQTLHCQAGDHDWQRQSQRGKRPRNCPSHAQIGQVVRKVELTQENREKNREEIVETIGRLSSRVQQAEIIDNIAYTHFLQNTEDDELFVKWLRENRKLLSEVIALRTNEHKLLELEI